MATQKSLKISPAAHRRMKLLSAELDFSADKLIVEALNAYEVTRTGVVRVGDIQEGAIRDIKSYADALQKIGAIVSEALNAAETPDNCETVEGTRQAVKRVAARLDKIGARED